MMIPTPQLPLAATTLTVLTVLLALHLSTAGGSDCRSSCGNIPVDYPFGLSTRCGHPGFQNLLYCSNGELMFHIPSGSLYRVFDIDYAYPSLIISMPDCYSLSHSSSFSLSGGGDGGFFLLGRGSGSNAIRVSCLVPPDQDRRGSCRECEDAATEKTTVSVSVIGGPSSHSWQPVMTADSTSLCYWLNWRVLLCAIWVLLSMIIASILIWKFEGPNSKTGAESQRQETLGTLYDDEPWRTCLTTVHPAWLLVFRVTAFLILLTLLVVNVVVDGGSIFLYYTEWTFLLVTIYFGLGSLLSVYGWHQYLSKEAGDRVDHVRFDAEHGAYMASKTQTNANERRPSVSSISEENVKEHGTVKNSGFSEDLNNQAIAGFWGYLFQIIYQATAGAVILTDCVFWLIIFPFRATKDYDLNLLLIGMHTVNAVFLLGDIALNCLRFPWFRISYFLLWTSGYVIFQWVIHACVSIWWPYPFLDLSAPHAPLWYFVVAMLHIPCYAVFPLIIKLKHYLLLRWFPQSYSCRR